MQKGGQFRYLRLLTFIWQKRPRVLLLCPEEAGG